MNLLEQCPDCQQYVPGHLDECPKCKVDRAAANQLSDWIVAQGRHIEAQRKFWGFLHRPVRWASRQILKLRRRFQKP